MNGKLIDDYSSYVYVAKCIILCYFLLAIVPYDLIDMTHSNLCVLYAYILFVCMRACMCVCSGVC